MKAEGKEQLAQSTCPVLHTQSHMPHGTHGARTCRHIQRPWSPGHLRACSMWIALPQDYLKINTTEIHHFRAS